MGQYEGRLKKRQKEKKKEQLQDYHLNEKRGRFSLRKKPSYSSLVASVSRFDLPQKRSD